MGASEYWTIAVETIVGDLEIKISKDKLIQLTQDIEGAAGMEEEASGSFSLPDPIRQENDT